MTEIDKYKLKDKNGVELHVGQVVEITGGYFKHDNGLFLVTREPGGENWLGTYYSLIRLTKKRTVSKQKYNLGQWPIGVYVSDYYKRLEAKAHNAKHAAIEVMAWLDAKEVLQDERF